MKRRIILSLLPALMLLTSCVGYHSPVDADKNHFVEDTLSHDEIFGEEESLFLKSPRKLSPIDSSVPAVAIQSTHEVTGETSIRFVAAIRIDTSHLDKITVSWRRTMFNADGSVLKTVLNKTCSKVYTSVKDGGSNLSIEDFNADHETSYTHFALYTMRGIPTNNEHDYSNCYLTTYLTVTDAADDTYNVTSKVVATTIDQETKFSFNASDTSYFGIKKTTTGFEKVTATSIEEGDNHAAFEGVSLSKSESFLIVNRWIDVDPSKDWFEVHGFSKVQGNQTFDQVDGSQFSKPKYDLMSYKFYLSKKDGDNNKVFTNCIETIYLDPNTEIWGNNNETGQTGYRFAMYYTNNGANLWYSMTQVGTSGIYSATITTIDPTKLTLIIFCKMWGDNPDNGWGGQLLHQTGDLTWHSNKNQYTITASGGSPNNDANWVVHNA